MLNNHFVATAVNNDIKFNRSPVLTLNWIKGTVKAF